MSTETTTETEPQTTHPAFIDETIKNCLEVMQFAKQNPMNARQQQTMINLNLSTPEQLEPLWAEMCRDLGLANAVRGRIAGLGLPWEPGPAIFIASIVTSPAEITLYVSYLTWRAKRRGCSLLDMWAFVLIFPNGFLSEEDLERAWDGQKCFGKDMPTSNVLDSKEFADYIAGMEQINA